MKDIKKIIRKLEEKIENTLDEIDEEDEDIEEDILYKKVREIMIDSGFKEVMPEELGITEEEYAALFSGGLAGSGVFWDLGIWKRWDSFFLLKSYFIAGRNHVKLILVNKYELKKFVSCILS